MHRLILTLGAAGLMLLVHVGTSADGKSVELRPDNRKSEHPLGQTSEKSRSGPHEPDRILEDTAGTPGSCEFPYFSPFESGSPSCRL
jgi:hypothetical protein